ncbi:hypothetical protein O6H91_07G074500 [Diphasiastrum complanatum]|uniref:Uncharacterized protein n=1 Tax=Diphasiastrum complanatum TaxID=34168 RepID=A0ACC2D6L0_DIPCM|nr:hypothetical protein O6H91_07G074500 [Diphasiastrum complanatum]
MPQPLLVYRHHPSSPFHRNLHLHSQSPYLHIAPQHPHSAATIRTLPTLRTTSTSICSHPTSALPHNICIQPQQSTLSPPYGPPPPPFAITLPPHCPATSSFSRNNLHSPHLMDHLHLHSQSSYLRIAPQHPHLAATIRTLPTLRSTSTSICIHPLAPPSAVTNIRIPSHTTHLLPARLPSPQPQTATNHNHIPLCPPSIATTAHHIRSQSTAIRPRTITSKSTAYHRRPSLRSQPTATVRSQPTACY